MAAKPSTLRPPGWPKAIRWGIGVFVLVGLATWFLAKPDPRATQQQQICQSWGITDAEVLAKCRQGREQVSAAIEPFKRSAVEREIAEFNQDLSALTSGKTHANDTNYPSRSIEEVEKVAGGMLGFIVGPKDGVTIPAKGQRIKLFGVIVTNEPDPEDGPGERTRYFTLETETPSPSAAVAHQSAVSMPATVNLDIESLNRYERQFITDHCHSLSVTPCRATVLGHIDAIVGRSSAWQTYLGVVADQVDIVPLDGSSAFREGFLSTRTLIKESKGHQ
jgi:hypothetical protein